MNLNKTKIADKLLKLSQDKNKFFNKKNLLYVLLSLLMIVFIIFIILYIYYKNNDDYSRITFWEYLAGKSNSTKINIEKEQQNNINKMEEDKCCAVELPDDKCEDKKEVFHIANQDYTYDQAKCKCESYGGSLATYNQLVQSYNDGADWCSYGWSEGQTAYYPTQQKTYDLLQEGPEEDRDNCGKVGLNGGLFIDPTIKFGVNCFAIKPKGKVVKFKDPVDDSNNNNDISFCEAPQNYEANNPLTSDEILPFNNSTWSNL